MAKNFEIPGKFSIDLADISMVTYDTELKTIIVAWKDPKRNQPGAMEATTDDFKKLQEALAARRSPGATFGRK